MVMDVQLPLYWVCCGRSDSAAKPLKPWRGEIESIVRMHHDLPRISFDYESGGREFESSPVRQRSQWVMGISVAAAGVLVPTLAPIARLIGDLGRLLP